MAEFNKLLELNRKDANHDKQNNQYNCWWRQYINLGNYWAVLNNADQFATSERFKMPCTILMLKEMLICIDYSVYVKKKV